jgi:hypothetical protein
MPSFMKNDGQVLPDSGNRPKPEIEIELEDRLQLTG